MHLSCRNALLYVKAAYYMYIMTHSIEYTFYNPTSQDGNLNILSHYLMDHLFW